MVMRGQRILELIFKNKIIGMLLISFKSPNGYAWLVDIQIPDINIPQIDTTVQFYMMISFLSF